jgi:hypothetical protein
MHKTNPALRHIKCSDSIYKIKIKQTLYSPLHSVAERNGNIAFGSTCLMLPRVCGLQHAARIRRWNEVVPDVPCYIHRHPGNRRAHGGWWVQNNIVAVKTNLIDWMTDKMFQFFPRKFHFITILPLQIKFLKRHHYQLSFPEILCQWTISGLGFDSRPAHVRFVVDRVALGQAVLRVLRFLSVSIVPTVLHTHMSFIYHRCYITLAIDTVVKQNTLLSPSVRFSHDNLQSTSIYSVNQDSPKIIHQERTSPGCQVTRASKFCMVAYNTFGSSV